MSKSQITSLFEAEKLWAKGFSGAKVRMAVFDTGVRSDHPHFRNIEVRISPEIPRLTLLSAVRESCMRERLLFRSIDIYSYMTLQQSFFFRVLFYLWGCRRVYYVISATLAPQLP